MVATFILVQKLASRMKLKIFLIIFAAAFSIHNAAAKNVDFELARIDGSKFISNKEFFGKKAILIFFDIDCPPCIKKLYALKEKTPDLTQLNIAVINLSVRKEAKIMLFEIGLDERIEVLQSPSNPKFFLRKFGNNSGALPYVVLLNEAGNFCLSKTEMFSDFDLKNCK